MFSGTWLAKYRLIGRALLIVLDVMQASNGWGVAEYPICVGHESTELFPPSHAQESLANCLPSTHTSLQTNNL